MARAAAVVALREAPLRVASGARSAGRKALVLSQDR